MRTRDHAGVPVPPPLLFATPLLAAVFADRQWPMWPVLPDTPATMLMAAGVALIVGGGLLIAASVTRFRRARTTILPAMRPTTAIVAQGPYRYSRNPMYLAMALIYAGAALVLRNAWALLFFPAALVFVNLIVIRREERYLTGKFGDAYGAYCRKVRRWI